jgi:stress response protein YsnF
MITREQIPQVVGHPVHDAEGKKVGDAKHMYLDDSTGNPEWVTVKTGFFGSAETFVPTRSARLVEDHLEVPYPKEKIKGAPNVDVDSGGHLSVDEERQLYRYYGIERQGGKGMSEGTGGAAGAAAGAGTAAAAKGRGTAETAPDMGKSGSAGMATGEGGGGMAAAETGAGAGFAAGRTGAAERLGAGGIEAEDEVMTRSEEEMHVKVERHASGRARLHKYVEVEEVEQTVPLRHEEVKLEREPLSAADRAALRTGAQISEAESVVTLHEESPVVETEVVAKERVRMRIEERTEQKKVRGRVRKERIETDMQGPTDMGAMPGEADPGGRNRPER